MFFIDVQGTLIDDLHRLPIDGAVEFIDALNRDITPYMVVTNNTKLSSSDFLTYLQSLGLSINNEHYLDPLMVLKDNLKVKNVAIYGSTEFIEVVTSMGYTLDFEAPQAVLVSIKKEFTNEEYSDMIGFILNGAQLVGMHETSLYSKDGRRYPGVGAILQMLKFATGCSYSVVGKPSDTFYNRAKDMLSMQINSQIEFKEITMISDDMKGDLVGVQNLGAKGVFVLSGKFRSANEILPRLSKDEQPSLVCTNIAQFNNSYMGVSI